MVFWGKSPRFFVDWWQEEARPCQSAVHKFLRRHCEARYPAITKITCTALECLKPVSSANQLRSTSSSRSVGAAVAQWSSLSISLSTSSVLPTIQSESQLPMAISISSTTTSGNSLNISASSLSIETRLFSTTSEKFATLSSELQATVPLMKAAATTSTS
ncbi:hypothetical protein TNCV_4809071 [Trichonephila clavipes]|nr:hypothetical protein TNCV_4809071 [Trichonephila clavipes]